jgi:Periplasmic binding protein domain
VEGRFSFIDKPGRRLEPGKPKPAPGIQPGHHKQNEANFREESMAALSRKLAFIIGAGTLALMSTATYAKDVKVGIVAVNYNSPTINRMVVTATEAAKKRGWTVETFDGQGDQVATNNAAMGFIDRGFNAIINIASPNPQMTAVIDHAKEKGVPFVSTFSGLNGNIVADIGSNNTSDGVISTTELIGRLGGKGHIVKLNWNVLPALRERDHGFKATLADYPDIKVTEIEVKVPGQVDDAYYPGHQPAARQQGHQGDLDRLGRARRADSPRHRAGRPAERHHRRQHGRHSGSLRPHPHRQPGQTHGRL